MIESSRCYFYDNLELACIRGYRLSVQLRDGKVVEGTARDLQTRAGAREYLMVNSQKSNCPVVEIPLDQIKTIEVHEPGVSSPRVLVEPRDRAGNKPG